MSIAASVPRVAVFANGERGRELIKALNEVALTPLCVVSHGTKFADTEWRTHVPDGTPHLHMNSREVKDWLKVSKLLRSVEVDVGVVAGFSYLIPDSLLTIPRLGFLNLHAGAVPAYRGGSPLNWQMINGEAFAGLTILRMTSGLDDGPVVATQYLPLASHTTIRQIHALANQSFPRLLVDVLRDLDRSIASAKEQDHSSACYWHQRSDLDGRFVPSSVETSALERLVRAIGRPYPGAWAIVDNKVLRLFEVSRPALTYRGTPGRIVKLAGEAPVIVLPDGVLALVDYELGGSCEPLRNGMYVR